MSEKQETEMRNYGFYSKVLNKPFDTLEELKAAEKYKQQEEEEKNRKTLERKAEAAKVEDAFKKVNSARKDANEKIKEVEKNCAKKIAEAKAEYWDAVADAEKFVEDAQKEYENELKAFQEKHPEGYHLTLKDGDNTLEVSNSKNGFGENAFEDLMNLYEAFINLF